MASGSGVIANRRATLVAMAAAVTAVGSNVGPDLVDVDDERIAARITDETTKTRTALNAAIDVKVGDGLQAFPQVVNVTHPAPATTPRAVGSFHGFLWGERGGQFFQSTDGKTWVAIGSVNPWPGSIQRIAPTSDGEVIVAHAHQISKSLGWSTNPATASWSIVFRTPDTDTQLAAFNMDFNDPAGRTFIVAHYTGNQSLWSKSRYVWLSTDSGNTWSVVYDSVQLYGAGPAAESHIHGVCYDSWEDRLWVSEGHATVVGVRWSDDHGATWSKISKGELASIAMAPTTLVATPTGILCGSDSIENGAYGIARVANPAELAMEWIWQWRKPEGWSGAPGFGQGGSYDPKTKLAYIAFQTSASSLNPVIIAGDALGASPILTVKRDSGEGARSVMSAFASPDGKHLVATTDITGVERIHADIITRGAPPTASQNRGNIFGGEARNVRSVAVGAASVVAGNVMASVAIGTESVVSFHDSIAMGYASSVSQQRSIAIGARSSAPGTDSVAIGSTASAGNSSTAIGSGVNLGSRANTIAIGRGSSAAADDVIVLGNQSSGAKGSSVVVGGSAKSTGHRSVVIGHGSDVKQQRTVAIGAYTVIADSPSSMGATVVGHAAEGGPTGNVAMGASSKALANNTTAIGAAAEATHNNSVVIGYGVKSTDINQIGFGNRHIEITASIVPAAPSENKCRLFLFNNSGVPELRIRTATGTFRITTEAV